MDIIVTIWAPDNVYFYDNSGITFLFPLTNISVVAPRQNRPFQVTPRMSLKTNLIVYYWQMQQERCIVVLRPR